MTNQEAWNEIQVKELNLCISRCDKALEIFDKIHKVLPTHNPQNISGELRMAFVHLRTTKTIAQEELAKRTS